MRNVVYFDTKSDNIHIFSVENQKIYYAGTKISLFVVENNELTEIKGDRQSIGYFRSKDDFKYTCNEIDINSEKVFYISSDGFYDQNGGNKDLSFGKKRFKKLILQNCYKSLSEQKEIFCNELEKYMGKNSQRDDITVIGFKIN